MILDIPPAIIGQEDMEYEGYQYKAYRRTYGAAAVDLKFCGGIYSAPIWIEKNTILDRLHFNGFNTEIEHDAGVHPNGPSCSIYAFK